ncbi:MAG: 2-amino-4-hydroxy-6-hydroxymethyldihydropteridine diphosphokinase [Thermodesulfobacteriota bacterium]|nr:2-amino-4-hydroxy-6-hydroxymethyldihydropteridine diphosphokinase [Thermodesulfobacteriota bacterium]
MNQRHIAYISVGSNIGNRLENCKNSIISLAESEISIVMAESPFYMTEPVDYIDQDWFINLVIKIETRLDPFELLDKLKLIQNNAGREHDAVRFGPRILDLDIFMYDDFVINSPELIIPHPRMHKRRFVLKPVCDIDPHIVHPVLKRDMQYLLDRLDDGQIVKKLKEQDLI